MFWQCVATIVSDNDGGSQHCMGPEWDLNDEDGMIYWASDLDRESVVHLAVTKVHTALCSNVYIYIYIL